LNETGDSSDRRRLEHEDFPFDHILEFPAADQTLQAGKQAQSQQLLEIEVYPGLVEPPNLVNDEVPEAPVSLLRNHNGRS
jgi:hypothetical protein